MEVTISLPDKVFANLANLASKTHRRVDEVIVEKIECDFSSDVDGGGCHRAARVDFGCDCRYRADHNSFTVCRSWRTAGLQNRPPDRFASWQAGLPHARGMGSAGACLASRARRCQEFGTGVSAQGLTFGALTATAVDAAGRLV